MGASIKTRLDIESDLLKSQYEKTSNGLDVDTQIFYLYHFLSLLKISISDLIEIADAISTPYSEEIVNDCCFCKDEEINKIVDNHKLKDIESYMTTLIYVVVNSIETMVEENPKLSSLKFDHIWNELLDNKYYYKNYGAMNWLINLKELKEYGIKISFKALKEQIKSNLPKNKKEI